MNYVDSNYFRYAIPWSQKLARAFTVGLLVLGLQSASHAAMLTVNLAGFDVRFKGGDTNIVDDTSDMYDSAGDPNVANELDAATVTNNNTMTVDFSQDENCLLCCSEGFALKGDEIEFMTPAVETDEKKVEPPENVAS